MDELRLWENNANKILKIDSKLQGEVRERLIEFLRSSKDVFAWPHEDMLGIDLVVASYRLKVDPDMRPFKQKKRLFNIERYQ